MNTLLSFILVGFFLTGTVSAQSFVLPEGMSETDRKKFERFQTFQIKGVCGDTDLDRLAKFGVNTVRGYTIPSAEVMREKLDHAHRLGMKVIVSEWMPHQGENKSRNGSTWDFDYAVRGEKMVKDFIAKVEGIGDHPALLMWGLGNEVHLDEPYLRVVNRMSEEIHKRFPHHLTNLTVINVKEEGIEAIKKYAPDIDVLGVQSYSLGAVGGSIKKAEVVWGKPFYMSEFNTKGPWNFGKTPWGVELDEPVSRKVSDLIGCYKAIDASPLCLGSTIFVWGHATSYRPTYFSLLLNPHPEGIAKNAALDELMITPQAEVMIENFTGQPPAGNRAPVLTRLEFHGGLDAIVAAPGEPMNVLFEAEDPNDDTVEFVTWILDAKARPTKAVAGPFLQASPEHAVINAPEAPGEYLLMAYAKDNKGGASASTIAFKVPDPTVETPSTTIEEAQP